MSQRQRSLCGAGLDRGQGFKFWKHQTFQGLGRAGDCPVRVSASPVATQAVSSGDSPAATAPSSASRQRITMQMLCGNPCGRAPSRGPSRPPDASRTSGGSKHTQDASSRSRYFQAGGVAGLPASPPAGPAGGVCLPTSPPARPVTLFAFHPGMSLCPPPPCRLPTHIAAATQTQTGPVRGIWTLAIQVRTLDADTGQAMTRVEVS